MFDKIDGDKLYEIGMKNAEKFRWISDHITKATVTGTDEENMKNISHLSSIDMAMGAEVMKTKHILTGVVIGSVSTLATVKLIDAFKKRRVED